MFIYLIFSNFFFLLQALVLHYFEYNRSYRIHEAYCLLYRLTVSQVFFW